MGKERRGGEGEEGRDWAKTEEGMREKIGR